MKTLLVFPPFSDPTQSYVSLPVLKAHLSAKGFDATIADFNVESVRFLFRKENVDRLKEAVSSGFRRLDRAESLSLSGQLEYERLLKGMRALEALPSDYDVLGAFRAENRFYDYGEYAIAVDAVELVFDALSALCFPYKFGLNYAGHFTLPWSFSMLDSYVNRGESPLIRFYEEKRGKGAFDGVRLLGISLTFVSQIPEAFTLARYTKSVNPDCMVVIGGTCMSQIACSLPDETLLRVFEYADYLCIGDGEETLEHLMRALENGSDRDAEVLQSIPNIVFMNAGKGTLRRGPASAFDIRTSRPPDFSDLDLDSYLAPSRMLLYSPTRRCYWKKCSFCTYGMSFSNEYGYREIDPVKAVSDLEYLSKRYGVTDFYFSCDVLSPAYAKKLAREIVKRGLAIRWSSDLRIDPAYTKEACGLLRESGMRSVAFGAESGSDRVLGLMNKGITSAMTRSVNAAFDEAGIATQWMTFTYHPGETPRDADATIDLIRRETGSIGLFIAGEFQLVPGSRIANDPAAYGIRRVFFTRGDEFRLYPLFTLSDYRASSLSDRERIDARVYETASLYALRTYPWAGAISTHHSFLYFITYGPGVFRTLAKERTVKDVAACEKREKNRIKPRFSVKRIGENTRRFNERIQEALAPVKKRGGSYEARLSAEYIESILGKSKPLYPTGSASRKR